jgi:DNA-binding PadR family transcriptional regulator
MERRSTDFAVLGMLTLKPMSGYDIRATIGESIAYFWTESFGQIYPTLNRLAKEGLVTRRGERGASRTRHIYSITGAGRDVLAAWLRQAPQPRPPRNELLFKLFFSRHAAPADAIAQVERFREAALRDRARFQESDRELLAANAGRPDLPYWMITLRYSQLEAEAHLRWASEALELLREMEQQVPPSN